MVQVTYQKDNGSIFQRKRETVPDYKIGERTSMGWTVLNIEYEYNNKYYSSYDFYTLIHQAKHKYLRKKETKENIKKEFKSFMYYFIAVLLINCLKFILGIR